MKQHQFLWIKVAAIGLFLVASQAAVAGHGKGPGFHHGKAGFGDAGIGGPRMFRMARMLDRLAEELEITEDQRAQLKQIRTDTRDQIEPLVQDLKANRQAVAELARADTLDQQALDELAQQRGALVSELTVVKAASRQQMRNVLTEDQLAQLEEKKAARRR